MRDIVFSKKKMVTIIRSPYLTANEKSRHNFALQSAYSDVGKFTKRI